MPSLETSRLINSVLTNNSQTIGQIVKDMSDFVMEDTWDNNLQSKHCFIYDHFHDDQPHLNRGMTYELTKKTPIDIKFIVSSYGSIDKDQVAYHIQFKPSQKVEDFIETDDLYYYQTDYANRYGATFPVGMWIDIPDEKGVYQKWLILAKEDGNQFTKYSVLPANYYLMWIEDNGTKRIKRKMWSVLRLQSSYNSGLWTDRYITRQENQDKIWLPHNSITDKLWYTQDDSHTMRLVVSALTEHPLVWKISKVENMQPFGIQKLTLYQDTWNPHTDYVNIEEKEMFANYYNSKVDIADLSTSDTVQKIRCDITSTSTFLKLGGSYRTLTASFYDVDDIDITDRYTSTPFTWSVDEKYNSYVTFSQASSSNQIKIKISNNLNFIGDVITITCTNNGTIGTIQLELRS